MPKRIILVDGDIFAYRAASANQQDFDWGNGASQTTDLPAARAQLDEGLMRLADHLKADKMVVCLSGGYNFRKTVYPLYKANRTKPKPVLLPALTEHLEENYDVKRKNGLEADDCLGIMATRVSADELTIVSDDKDLRQIPGSLFVPRTSERLVISRTDADRSFFTQCITGDATDGYPGAFRHGPKSKYVHAVSRRTTAAGMWATVVAAYRNSIRRFGADRVADPLTQARCARILRAADWDFRRQVPKLWQPPT